MDLKNWNDYINSYRFSRLDSTSNKYFIQSVTQFHNKGCYIPFDIVFHRYKNRFTLKMISAPNFSKIIFTSCEYYIHAEGDGDWYIFIHNWNVQPTIESIYGKFTCDITCHGHNDDAEILLSIIDAKNKIHPQIKLIRYVKCQ